MAKVLTQPRSATGMQEKLENSTRKLLIIAIGFIPLALILAFQIAGGLGPLQSPGAMDYGQLARNILAGKGYVTDQLTPLAAALSHPGSSTPDITHPPLYPMVLAMLFGALGSGDAVVAGASAGFFVLSALMVFLICKRQFSLSAAALATALFASQFEIVRYAFAGTNILVGAFFMLLFWYVLTSPNNRAPLLYFKAGVIFALCYLTQYSFALFVPAILVYIYCVASGRKLLCVIVFLFAAILVSSPWLIRNAMLMHNPFFTIDQYDILMNTDSYAGYNIHRTFFGLPSLFIFPITHIAEIARKAMNGFVVAYWQFPIIAGLYILPFFILSVFYRVDDDTLRAQRSLLLTLIAIQTVGMCLGDQVPMHLVKLTPLVIIFASSYLIYLLDRCISTKTKRALLLVALVLVASIPTGMEVARNTKPMSSDVPAVFAELSRKLPRDANVITDCPWAMAWYGRKRSIWLPINLSRMDRLERKVGRVDAVFVSQYATSFLSMDAAELGKSLSRLTKRDDFHAVRMTNPGGVLLVRGQGND